MHLEQQAAPRPRDLRWVIFLLTGGGSSNESIVSDGLGSQGSSNTFFINWMKEWSRKVAIAKALDGIRQEIADSADRTKLDRAEFSIARRGQRLDPAINRSEIEKAILPIDVFPRCVLVLTVLEGLPFEDTALLLGAGEELTKKGYAVGLQEFTNQLVRMQAGPSWRPGSAIAA